MEALQSYSDSSNSEDEKQSSRMTNRKQRTVTHPTDHKCVLPSPQLHDIGSGLSKSSCRSRSRSPVRKGSRSPIRKNRPRHTEHRRTGPKQHTLPATDKGHMKVEVDKKGFSTNIAPVLPGKTNPLKFETIQEKRKRLWSSKKEKKSLSKNQWEHATFTDGGDKAQAKFRRLMGMSATKSDRDNIKEEHTDTLKNLEHQYETSRFLTHVARGVGLGFTSTSECDSLEK